MVVSVFRLYLDWWCRRDPPIVYSRRKKYNPPGGRRSESPLSYELFYWSAVERDLQTYEHLGGVGTTAMQLPWSGYTIIIRNYEQAISAVYSLPNFSGNVILAIDTKSEQTTNKDFDTPLQELKKNNFWPSPNVTIYNKDMDDQINSTFLVYSHDDVMPTFYSYVVKIIGDYWSHIRCLKTVGMCEDLLSPARFPFLSSLHVCYRRRDLPLFGILANKLGCQLDSLGLIFNRLLTESEQKEFRLALSRFTNLQVFAWKPVMFDCLDAVTYLSSVKRLNLKFVRDPSSKNKLMSVPFVKPLKRLDVEIEGEDQLHYDDLFHVCAENEQLRELKYINKCRWGTMNFPGQTRLMDRISSLHFPKSLCKVVFHCLLNTDGVREYERFCLQKLCRECPQLRELAMTVHVRNDREIEDFMQMFCTSGKEEEEETQHSRNQSLQFVKFRLHDFSFETEERKHERKHMEEKMESIDTKRFFTRLQSFKYFFVD
jgi:hypothetical protein